MSKKPFEVLSSSNKLPQPAAVGKEVLELSRYGKCTPEEVERVLSRDQQLSQWLVQLANGERGGQQTPFDTVSSSAMALGIPVLRTATLAFSFFAGNRKGGCSAFDYDDFWSRSVARAVSAQTLSRVIGIGTPAEAFALGMLGEIGRLALANVHSEKYAELLSGAGQNSARELAEAERRLFGIDHGEVAASLLEEWGVPAAFAAAVRRYESLGPATTGSRVRCIDELLHVAHSTARFCMGASEAGALPERSGTLDIAGLARRLGMSQPDFHETCSRIVVSYLDWMEELALEGGAAGQGFGRAGSGHHKSGAHDPQADGSAQPAGTRKASAEASGGEVGLRVLAVDDDPVSLALLQRHLLADGHELTVAHSGDEALRIAIESPPQLVVADWQMPGIDGIELCRELRRLPFGRKLYFLLLTGHGEVENVVRAFDAGVDDYVEKPFDPRILLARIKAGRRIIGLQEQVEQDELTQKKQVAELQLLAHKLKLAAMTDVLTGLPNRRFAMKRLARAWEQAESTEGPLSIVMIDIDEFKRVNDDHGHDAGDAVLRETGRLLRSILREKEDVCRLGGEEFLVICAGGEMQDTVRLAERLRVAVERNVVRWADYEGSVTLSLGVALRESWMPSSDELLKAADEAVYEAKRLGRNQVRIAPGRSGPHRRSA